MTFKKLKVYIKYLSIMLLGQRVNNFDIIYINERIAVITVFDFLAILFKLEIYLGFTN
jgi:hypothetical protein